jgi:hypothetical protein
MKLRIWLCLVVLVMLAPRMARAQTGEFRVNGGLMTGLGSGGTTLKPLIRASFSFVKSKFSFGPEISWASDKERIFGIGVVSRFQLGSSQLHPYLVGGLGGNYWRGSAYGTAGLFTGSIGGGISLVSRRSIDLTLESRLHKNLQNYGGGNWDFISVAAGVRVGW